MADVTHWLLSLLFETTILAIFTFHLFILSSFILFYQVRLALLANLIHQLYVHITQKDIAAN